MPTLPRTLLIVLIAAAQVAMSFGPSSGVFVLCLGHGAHGEPPAAAGVSLDACSHGGDECWQLPKAAPADEHDCECLDVSVERHAGVRGDRDPARADLDAALTPVSLPLAVALADAAAPAPLLCRSVEPPCVRGQLRALSVVRLLI